METRKTPLDAWHRANGAKMVEFGGWEMPLQYSTLMAEHLAVRSAAGLFDISHMAQIEVSGGGAEGWLQSIFTNDVAMEPGRGVYSLMCNPAGGVIDDVFVFRLEPTRYFIVSNASRERADLAWLRSHSSPGAAVGARAARGALAIQGPAAPAILVRVAPEAAQIGRNRIARVSIAGRDALVSGTGYTGEEGFEVFTSADSILPVWETVWAAGQPGGLAPAGLGARDTLRLEMCYPLYGHELDEITSPYEAGYGWAVKPGKPVPFIGQEALRREKETGGKTRLAALVLLERGVAREGAQVFSGGERVGEVTSGTFSPSLEKAICLARVSRGAKQPFCVDIRDRRLPAQEVPKPFYNRAAGAAA